MEVSLVPMTAREFALFFREAVTQYAEENVKAGYWSERGAEERSAEEFRKLLPDGLNTKNNFLFTVRSKEEHKVGSVWLKLESSALRPSGFIYDIMIDEGFRGRGYGSGVMQAIEDKAKQWGLRSLALHVFASNRPAIHLYEKSGFKVKSMNMMKDL